jgi:hypothetical protein
MSDVTQKALTFAGAYLKWKTKPRLANEQPPNPADYDLSPEQGQYVIDTCHRAVEESAVEKATKAARAPTP